ncbi:MAG TPA: GntR family transcriptional regulator [Isosphaeraceae bacterium]|nr:GntR family transcriptional regulator [Isosphaeraceae bacterium]
MRDEHGIGRRVIATPVEPYRPLYVDAYRALRDAILQGRLRPGERIVEAEVARQMAISRAPIREAIRKLEHDGLVEYHPRRGAVIVRLSPAEVRDVYHVRAHLERYAARLAATRVTDADLAALARLIDEMRACAARDDLEALITADVAFHEQICRASGSRRTLQLWNSLNPQCWTLLTSLRATEYTLAEIAERHVPVLAALQARDPERAEAEIARHIIELAETVLGHLAPEPANSDAKG